MLVAGGRGGAAGHPAEAQRVADRADDLAENRELPVLETRVHDGRRGRRRRESAGRLFPRDVGDAENESDVESDDADADCGGDGDQGEGSCHEADNRNVDEMRTTSAGSIDGSLVGVFELVGADVDRRDREHRRCQRSDTDGDGAGDDHGQNRTTRRDNCP